MSPIFKLVTMDFSKPVLISIVLICVYNIIQSAKKRSRTVKAPVVGYRNMIEPTWLVRLRFIRGSRSILLEGYHQFKNSMFKIRRIGTDVLILSNKHIEDLRTLSGDIESSVEPMMNDFVGELTAGTAFLHSDLQNRVLQQKLIPSLASLASVMKLELDLALEKEFPCREEWMTVDIVPIFARIISRVSARIFLGPEYCQNEEWLTTTRQYTENLFMTGMFLRIFPRIVRPLVAHLFPPYRSLCRNRAAASRIIGGIVASRRCAEKEQGELYEKPSDILQYMMDMAVGEEERPENLAQRMLILSLSSIHTTALTMAQALYDLTAHPQYIDPIRNEVIDVLKRNLGWQKSALGHFKKLDSLLKESQRFNPIFLVTFNRILHKKVMLSNGTVLHPGTRIAVPSYHMLHDPEHVPGPASPSDFDPFRYARLREDPSNPDNANKFLFAMADPSNMAFGFGKHACPGRSYASDEMKMILGHLLLKYEWKFPEGQERPKNFTVDTDMYPDRSARLEIRKRDTEAEDTCRWL